MVVSDILILAIRVMILVANVIEANFLAGFVGVDTLAHVFLHFDVLLDRLLLAHLTFTFCGGLVVVVELADLTMIRRYLHALIFPKFHVVLVNLRQRLSTLRVILGRELTVGRVVIVLSRQRLHRAARLILELTFGGLSCSVLNHLSRCQAIVSPEVGL